MQVLLPQGDYTSISINGEALDLHVDDLRTNYLLAQIGDSGYGYIAHVKADSMQVVGGDTPLRFYGNKATSLMVSGEDGSVTFLENKPKDIQIILAETYVNMWHSDSETIKKALNNEIRISEIPETKEPEKSIPRDTTEFQKVMEMERIR